jgi:hypothetical protein
MYVNWWRMVIRYLWKQGLEKASVRMICNIRLLVLR